MSATAATLWVITFYLLGIGLGSAIRRYLMRPILRDLRRENQAKDSSIGSLRVAVMTLQDTINDLMARNAKLQNDLSVMGQYERQSGLARKLNTARATGSQQDERLKHQNNEMRVMMNRLHRHLSALDRVFSPMPDLGVVVMGSKEAVSLAFAEWKACNDWLAANKIEPYLGTVPGYDGQQAGEREKEVAPAGASQ